MWVICLSFALLNRLEWSKFVRTVKNSSMIFNTKKNNIERLRDSFGKQKDDSFNFEWIENYSKKKDNSDSFQVISEKTCSDLDFHELFKFVDRTNSKIGQQFLYNKLRVIPKNLHKRDEDEKLIEKLRKDGDFRVNIQYYLDKLDDTEAYYVNSLFQEEHIKPPKWFFIIRLLSFTSLMSLIMMFFDRQFFIVFIGTFIVNMGMHYWNKKNLSMYLSSLPQLLKMNAIVKVLYKDDSLKEMKPNLHESIGVVDSLRRRMAFFKLEAKMQGDFEMVFWGILELFKIAFLLEPLLLFGVLGRLEKKRKDIENLFEFVGEVDSLVSVASLREGLENYCVPDINENRSEIVAKEIYHPLISDCVRNSISVKDKSILLTGSNMSGKTSFIRTVGLNVITGLTINTCFAQSINIPRVRVYSAIRISDDLMNDKSYYFEEVLTIKEMMNNSSDSVPSLFLLDEIFKGTNTVERISAGKAVLSSLAMNNNIVFVSTHDIELADLLTDEYELHHFSEVVDNNNVDFDYKLKDGKLRNRNAIRILQINDYPESVIKEAIEISERLDKAVTTTTNFPEIYSI